MANKEPTKTSIVLEALSAMDDLVTVKQLRAATFGLTAHDVINSLCYLRKIKAVDCLSEGGELWWMATIASDQRTRKIEQRTPESKPRRKLKKREKNSATT
jgi:hypothetical protein